MFHVTLYVAMVYRLGLLQFLFLILSFSLSYALSTTSISDNSLKLHITNKMELFLTSWLLLTSVSNYGIIKNLVWSPEQLIDRKGLIFFQWNEVAHLIGQRCYMCVLWSGNIMSVSACLFITLCSKFAAWSLGGGSWGQNRLSARNWNPKVSVPGEVQVESHVKSPHCNKSNSSDSGTK